MMFLGLRRFSLSVVILLSLSFSCGLIAEIFKDYDGFKILRAESPLPRDKDSAQVFKETADFITTKLRSTRPDGKEAVIIDIDGTILAVIESFQPTIRSISPTIKIFKAAIESGRKVFFVTSRYEDGHDGTIAELTAIGVEPGSYELIMYPASSGGISLREDKHYVKGEQRSNVQEQGYNIVLTIDDDRDNLSSEFGPIGEETLLVPNPDDLKSGGLLGDEIKLGWEHSYNGQ